MRGIKLFIIEDEDAHFHLMKRAIEKAFPGILIEHFTEAYSCLEALNGSTPDVIVADYLVPGMSGIEFLEALQPTSSHVPVIMITGQGDESVAVQAMKLGASDYLVKAGDFFTLLPSVIERTLDERRLRRSLERSESRFEEIFERSPIGIALYDNNGCLVDANRSWLDMFGVADVAHMRRFDFVEYNGIWRHDDKGLPTEKMVRFETAFDFDRIRKEDLFETTRSGTVHLNVMMTPVSLEAHRSEDGYLVQVLDITEEKRAKAALQQAHDDLERRVEDRTAELAKTNAELSLEIQERIRTEKALSESEKRYRRIVETAHEGIWVVDANARVQYVNQQMANMLGYGVDEMSGRFLFDFVSDLSAVEAHQNLDVRSQEVMKQHDFRFRRKDGTDLWAMISSSPVLDEQGQYRGALGMVIDITKRRQAEDALRESQGNYRRLVENSLVGISIIQDDRIVFANKRFGRIFGYQKEEFAHLDSSQLFHPEDRAFAKEFRRRILTGEKVPDEYELRGLKKDGGGIWIKKRNTRIVYRGRPAILGNVVDVTEQKQAEARLQKANEELKSFLEVVSHDLKNPIFAIKGFSSLLRRRYDDVLEDRGREYLVQITRSAERMALLVSDLLSFARIGQVTPILEDISVLDIVNEITSSLRETLENDGIELTIAQNLPRVYWYRDILYQVLDNLLTNAVKFGRKADHPKVDVGYKDLGDCHEFFVRDNGIGIDPQYHDKVFEMFYRVNDTQDEEGTGLGLAIVKKAVTQHGGKVWLESEKGRGTTFYFAVPKQA